MLRRLVVVALLFLAPVLHARERAVFVYPKERWSLHRVFYTAHQKALRTQVAARFDLDIHEQVATREQLFAIDLTGAKLLVLSAHGDAFSMHFAGGTSRTIESASVAELAAFFERLDPFATIVLQSCHTGRGFAHAVKAAAGPTRRVIAARGEVPRDGLTIVSMEPFDVRLTCRESGSRFDCTLRLQ